MTGHRLVGCDWNTVSVILEQLLDRFRLRPVADLGAGRMRADYVHFLRCNVRFFERELHRPVGSISFRVSGDNMMRIRSRSIADHFGIDVCASALGMRE
ncbi:hypothetical protein D3C77_617060 [compost metagenome]